MKIDSYYQKGRYEGEAIRERIPYFFNRVKLFAQILKNYSFKKVLDAGCGDGGLMLAMNKKLGTEGYGIDISEKGVSIANKSGVRAKLGNLSDKIPFQNAYFDLVIANELIEHLVNPDKFLIEARRVLRKDGILLLCTPNISFWLNRILFVFGIYPLFLEASTEKNVGLGFISRFSHGSQPVGHIHVLNYKAVTDLLRFHGFKAEKVIGDSVAFAYPGSSIITLIYNILDWVFSKFPSLSSNLIIVARKK